MSITPFTDIYDLFLSSIKDYNLDSLYITSPTDFYNYLQGYLIMSIPDFDNCVQDLANYSLTPVAQFNLTLSLAEKTILANIMIIKWMSRQINDVTQMNLHLNDTDFKHYSEAQNLTAKVNYRNDLREMVNQDMTKYGLKNISWSNWGSGNFL